MAQQPTVRSYQFTPSDLGRVEDDLARILEDECWDGDALKLKPHKLMEKLRAYGHTWARIVSTLEGLVARGVLATPTPAPVTYKVGAGVLQSNPQRYVTTRERWFTYLAARRAIPEEVTPRDQADLSVSGDLQDQARTERPEATGPGAEPGTSGQRGRPRGSTTAASDRKLYLDWKAAHQVTGITKAEFVHERGLPASAVAAIERGRAQERRKRSGQN